MNFFRNAVTRYAGLSRRAAISIVTITALAILVLLVIALNHVPTPGAKSPESGDMAMYQRLVEHMRQGADYYAAARTELVNGHYGMHSVFNWRTPLLADFLALFPTLMMPQIILIGIALVAGLAACALVFTRLGLLGAELAALVLIVSLGACIPLKTVVLSEIVVGPILLLSLSAYGLRLPYLGLVMGLLALFLRELSAPFVLICIAFAWRERRVGELVGWALGLTVYAGYFLWHYHMVQLHTLPQDAADPSGWMQFGGADFLLATAGFNGLLVLAPLWPTAVTLPLSLVGILAWPGRVGARFGVTAFCYLVLFSIVGKPYNYYWGALYMPIVSMGLVWLPLAVRDLWRALKVPAGVPVQVTGI